MGGLPAPEFTAKEGKRMKILVNSSVRETGRCEGVADMKVCSSSVVAHTRKQCTHAISKEFMEKMTKNGDEALSSNMIEDCH